MKRFTGDKQLIQINLQTICNRVAAGFASLGLIVLSVAASNAQITKIGGSAGLTPLMAPASVQQGAHQSNSNIFAFAERKNVAVSGILTNLGGPVSGNVNSYMLYSDKIGLLGSETYDITVQFSENILGVLTGTLGLDLTDGLFGLSGTAYPISLVRGQEGPDFTTLSGNTLTIHNVTTSNVDEIRVLTAAVPEPGNVAMLTGFGLTGIATFFNRRRKAVRKSA